MNASPALVSPLAVMLSAEEYEAKTAKDFPELISKYRAITLDRLDEPGPEYESLIEGWLSVGDKSIIGGPSQSGKSFFAIHAGMCITTGRDFFGAEVKQGLVIYIAGEGARGVKKRLRAWRKHFGVTFTRETPFVLIQSPVDLYKQEGGDTEPLLEEIKAICAMFPNSPLRMIVIDTLATAAIGADENSSKDIGLVLANVAKLNTQTGAHVAICHHMNAGGDRLRGSTAIYANIEQAIYVNRNETTKVRTAKMGKHKDEEASTSIQFELLSVDLGSSADGKRISSCVCVPVGEKEAVRRSEEQKGFALTADEVILMRALFDADKNHGKPVPADMRMPAAVRSIVGIDDVKRAWAQTQPSDAMPSDQETPEEAEAAKKRHRETLKKRWQRLHTKLQQFGVLGVGEEPESKRAVMWWSGKALRAFPHTLPRLDPEPAPPPAFSNEMVDGMTF